MADDPENKNPDLAKTREEFLQVFRKGADFTEELLSENERLRYRVAEFEAREAGTDEGLIAELMDKVKRLETEHSGMMQRFHEVEDENRSFANRYVEIEAENNNLLNIYVASYQLHSTLDFEEVLSIITEITLNFVGAEEFAVAFMEEDGMLYPLIAEGIDKSDVAKSDIVGSVLDTGAPHFAENLQPAGEGDPVACIPHIFKDQAIGRLVIYKFLQQKTELAKVDHELFTLLAGHAATAIFSAKLYTDSQRKLNTIQGLIDLVTS